MENGNGNDKLDNVKIVIKCGNENRNKEYKKMKINKIGNRE